MPSLFPHSGPQLPSFKTLLVKGKFHPSAPIHLSLSYLTPSNDNQVVIITPSRQRIATALQDYNDDWLTTHSGLGATARLSSRVKLFYPPTPAHLCLLVSMFRISTGSDDKIGDFHYKTTLPSLPSLFILHEPSLYFLTSDLQPNSSHWTISSYMMLITHFLSSLTFLSRSSTDSGVALALFDTQLDQLKLPISKQLTTNYGTDEPVPRMESVTAFAERYFEWTSVFSQEEHESTDEGRTKHSMKLLRIDQGIAVAESSWWEVVGTGSRTVQFVWET